MTTQSFTARIVPRVLALSAMTLALAGAWATGAQPAAAADLSRVGALLPVAEFHLESASPTVVSARARGFASLLAGSEVPLAGADVPARAFAASPVHAEFVVKTIGGQRVLLDAPANAASAFGAPADSAGSDAELAARALASASPTADAAERIRILVDVDRGELLALHGAVADDFMSTPDIGSDGARAVFDATLASLGNRQLVQADLLAPAALRTGSLMQGERAPGGPVNSRVKEYIFEVPHAVAGIEVFGASTVVSVHRSGLLASVRSTGPVSSVSPTRAFVRRAVSAEALAQRARAENPNAKIIPVGLRYPWQATRDATLASRPREAFQVVPVTQVDGRSVNGRSHFVFYSVEDEKLAALVWPVAQPGATGDRGK